MKTNKTKLINCELEIAGYYPDFPDSYLHYAEYEDGTPLTDEELDSINREQLDRLYQLVINQLS